MKSSALVTGFVLAEGTHQTRVSFRRISISKYRYISDWKVGAAEGIPEQGRVRQPGTDVQQIPPDRPVSLERISDRSGQVVLVRMMICEEHDHPSNDIISANQAACHLLCWPLSKRPVRHDRFVLIGLCWLYHTSDAVNFFLLLMHSKSFTLSGSLSLLPGTRYCQGICPTRSTSHVSQTTHTGAGELARIWACGFTNTHSSPCLQTRFISCLRSISKGLTSCMQSAQLQGS